MNCFKNRKPIVVSHANDALLMYRCTDTYTPYLCGMLLTDGAVALADEFQCYWLLDIICSCQQQLNWEEFQVWTLKREEDTTVAVVTCTNGNDRSLCKQDIPYTDFRALTAVLWVEGQVILLPSEH